MALNRSVFFDSIRPLFQKHGGLSQPRVDGTNFLLDVWEEKFTERTPPTQFSVCLATTFHETAFTMQPIREHGNRDYFTKMYDINGARPHVARALGNLTPGDGAKFPGGGFVQLTGRANHRKATLRLRELGLIGPEVNFEAYPELVMQPRYAAMIMFIGMEEGWFTGKKLDQLVDSAVDGDEHADFLRSRAIINGTDRAEAIAGYADAFLAALVLALKASPKPTSTPAPVPIPTVTIEVPPTPEPSSTGRNVGGAIGGAVVLGSGTVVAQKSAAKGASTGNIAIVVGCTLIIAVLLFFVIRSLGRKSS